MNSTPSYARNDELFLSFQALQGSLVACLAGHPAVIRAWLEAQPPRAEGAGASGEASKSWRTARLSNARRRELTALIGWAEASPEEQGPLAAWLLTAVPVRTYLEIAEAARPSLAEIDAKADDCCRELIRLREIIFMANYGLARVAAQFRTHGDYDDRLSAASCGLLDAVDRYVPGEKAARFAYFASYWIRYHLSRHAQKCGPSVCFPINQHRVGRRIARYVADRRSEGLPPPSEAEICADLNLGLDAYHWHRCRPRMVSLHSPVSSGPESVTLEHLLCDPAPEPAAVLDEVETAAQLRSILRTHASPATRLMLAYSRGVGAVPEAAEDYLADLREQVRERMRQCLRLCP